MTETTRQVARVGVLGSGAWGLALARLFSREGHDVVVWSESEQVVERLRATRTIPLPGDPELPAEVALTTSVEEACAQRDVIVFVTSSRFVHGMAEQVAPFLRPDAVLVCATKGLEEGTLDTMTEVIAGAVARVRPDVEPVTVALSGPSHAEEVALTCRPASWRPVTTRLPRAACRSSSRVRCCASTPAPTCTAWSSAAPSRT